MTEADYKRIEAYCDAATPGPYTHNGIDYVYGGKASAIHDNVNGAVLWHHRGDVAKAFADGLFVCAARSDLPALVAACREKDRRIAELEQEVAFLTEALEK